MPNRYSESIIKKKKSDGRIHNMGGGKRMLGEKRGRESS